MTTRQNVSQRIRLERGDGYFKEIDDHLCATRSAHTVTFLRHNKKVLIAGGSTTENQIPFIDDTPQYSSDTAELYDPVANEGNGEFSWTVDQFGNQTKMSVPRAKHTATEFRDPVDGRYKVLIVGGFNTQFGTDNDTAEIYDPATGKFDSTPVNNNLTYARNDHRAVYLPSSNKILIVGGKKSAGGVAGIKQVEIFDCTTKTFSQPPGLQIAEARCCFVAALLPDEKVLITGGFKLSTVSPGFSYDVHASAQVIDVAGNHIDSILPMNVARNDPSFTTLSDGRILIVGGGAPLETPPHT